MKKIDAEKKEEEVIRLLHSKKARRVAIRRVHHIRQHIRSRMLEEILIETRPQITN